MIDVTGIDCREGDVVVVLVKPTVNYIAEKLNTISMKF
jgi:hypothetical protein